MYYNKKKGTWMATDPIHLIGWAIVLIVNDELDEDNMVELLVEKNDTKERRTVKATSDAIPVASITRRWNRLG